MQEYYSKVPVTKHINVIHGPLTFHREFAPTGPKRESREVSERIEWMQCIHTAPIEYTFLKYFLL